MQGSMVKVEQSEQGAQVVGRAVDVLASGKLLVIPTETVYGIAAWAGSDVALNALRSFKGRPDSQPFTLHLPDPGAAERYVDLADPVLSRLVRKGFPGPITLVADVPEDVAAAKLAGLGLEPGDAGRLYHQGTVGLRCPDSSVTRRILGEFGGPVVASSANLRGQPAPHSAGEAADAVGEAAALVVDDGPCKYAKASTIVRVRRDGGRSVVQVVREGVLDERIVRKLATWTMLLVCSGNTCRSPMAEGIGKVVLAERLGLRVDELEAAGYRVMSAGAFAAAGSPASGEAVEAMSKLGIDLSGHRSTPLSVELIHQADVIYCMGESHRRAVVAMVPSAAGKAERLDPGGDIDDPIGSSLTIYQRCAEVIRRRLVSRLQEQKL